MYDDIVNALKDVVKWLVYTLEWIVYNLISGIVSMFSYTTQAIVDAMPQQATDMINEAIPYLLDIYSTLDYYVPLHEVVVLEVSLMGFLIVFITVKFILKLIPMIG